MKSAVAFDPEFDAPAKGREKGRPKRRRLLEWLIALGISGLIAGFMLSPILNSENFGKPLGRAIPDQPPDEPNRVVNPRGFSIVIPPNWEFRSLDSLPFEGMYASIGASPRQLIPSRWGAGFAVERLRSQRPDLAEFQPTVFQGKPAYERVSRRAEVLFDNPPVFLYVLFFERDGTWYEMIYHVADDRESLPPIMLRYFNTFQVSEGA